MNKTIELLKIAQVIPRKYFVARKLLNADVQKQNEFIKEITSLANQSFEMEIDLINLNDNFDFDGCFMFANHQDNLDIYALVHALDYPIKFVAKKELFEIPLFKTYMKLSQSYSLDRKNARQGVKVFKAALRDVDKHNANVVIFPEGTRCKSPLMYEFNSGLFNIIKKVTKPLLPIHIEYDKVNFKKVKIVIGKAIKLESFETINGVALRDLIYDEICKLKRECGRQENKYNILGLGDSITFGENYQGEYCNGYFDKFVDRLEKEGLLASCDNLAVRGATIDDCTKSIENEEYRKLIIDSDYLIMSIGANDILQLVKKGKVEIDDIYLSFEEMYQKTDSLIKEIIKINKNIKIILIGLYFPYPHSRVLSKFNNMKVLDLYYQKLENKYKNLRCPSIFREIEEYKDSYLPSRRNIHLSDVGYSFVVLKVIEAFQSFYK